MGEVVDEDGQRPNNGQHWRGKVPPNALTWGEDQYDCITREEYYRCRDEGQKNLIDGEEPSRMIQLHNDRKTVATR